MRPVIVALLALIVSAAISLASPARADEAVSLSGGYGLLNAPRASIVLAPGGGVHRLARASSGVPSTGSLRPIPLPWGEGARASGRVRGSASPAMRTAGAARRIEPVPESTCPSPGCSAATLAPRERGSVSGAPSPADAQPPRCQPSPQNGHGLGERVAPSGAG
jgi:hypothetical protein